MIRCLFIIAFVLVVRQYGFSQIFSSDFETWTNGVPADWQGDLGNLSQDSISGWLHSSNDGDRALQIMNRSNQRRRICSETFPASGKLLYSYSYWVRGHGLISVGVGCFTSSDTVIHYPFWDTVNSNTWTKVTKINAIVAESHTIGVQFVISVKNTYSDQNHIQVDDFNIQSIPSYAVSVGDTLEVRALGATGDIQWQESQDSLNWVDLTGLTDSIADIVVTGSPGMRYYRAKISNLQICENSSWYSSIASFKVIASTNDIHLGDWYHGGTAFYTDSAGNGLIAHCSAEAARPWGCYNTSIPGASGSTNGINNTAAIIASCSDPPIAARFCVNDNANGYSDWYLPAKDQLHKLLAQRNIIGDLPDVAFWSSTEYDAAKAWTQLDTVQMALSKYGEFKFSCIRSFSSIPESGKTIVEYVVCKSPFPAVIISNLSPRNVCEGNEVVFTIWMEGTGPFAYQWEKDGQALLSDTGNTLSISDATTLDEGVYLCNINGRCNSLVSDSALLKVIRIETDAGPDMRMCVGNSVQLSALASSNHSLESGIISYTWTPLAGISNSSSPNPVANPDITTDYFVRAADNVGCFGVDTVIVTVGNVFQDENICLVTVDTLLRKNKIIWEITPFVGTASTLMYKEIYTGVYQQIGSINIGSPGFIIDLDSKPDSQSTRYKISVIDTCGNESEKSYFQSTIFLAPLFDGYFGNLSWIPYYDESGTFSPSVYYIFRSGDSTNFMLIDSVSGSQTSYMDNGATGSYFYMVAVKKAEECIVSTENISFSFSNKANPVEIGIKELVSEQIYIYPNPFTSQTTISTPITDYRLLITDISGKVVFEDKNASGEKYVLQRGTLESGMYFLEITNCELRITRKLVIN
ncbi:MAG: T9SS type A sorting domain-containing protein [Bacteroidetes bacterium]|nr:T9SS type A sorting domain-containing protein [Bacteroidota bacterium]MBU1718239.1 T9SS type A sorting domain-containing protein [Bacteroidota bacterium]